MGMVSLRDAPMKGGQTTAKRKGNHRAKGSGTDYPKESEDGQNLVAPVVAVPRSATSRAAPP